MTMITKRWYAFMLLALLAACKKAETPVPPPPPATVRALKQERMRAERIALVARTEKVRSQQNIQIVDGEKTPANTYQECVAIGDSATWFCSGTLVGKNVVVTAGHCAEKGITRVFFGPDVTNLPGGAVEQVMNTYTHPSYVAGTPYNDIAICVLKNDVSVKPVPLSASVSVPSTGTDVTIAGFGSTDTRGTSTFGTRRFGTIKLLPCTTADAATGCDPGTELIGSQLQVAGACGGDSGGPVYGANRALLLGSVSRRAANATTPCGSGAIYERVDKYAAWMKTQRDTHW
jgi:secreted trypsin-like serine protease